MTHLKAAELGVSDEQFERLYNYYDQLVDEAAAAPSFKRRIVATSAELLTIGVGAFAIETFVATPIAVAVATLTGSAFATFMAVFLTMAIAFLALILIGDKVGKYIASKQIDRDFVSLKDHVWFMFNQSGAAA